jgi:putative flippase GtrA
MIFSYLANKYITFNHKKSIKSTEIGGFIIVSGLGFAVNTLILQLTIMLLGSESISILSSNLLLDTAILGKILGTGGSMIVNFIGYKFFVFRK